MKNDLASCCNKVFFIFFDSVREIALLNIFPVDSKLMLGTRQLESDYSQLHADSRYTWIVVVAVWIQNIRQEGRIRNLDGIKVVAWTWWSKSLCGSVWCWSFDQWWQFMVKVRSLQISQIVKFKSVRLTCMKISFILFIVLYFICRPVDNRSRYIFFTKYYETRLIIGFYSHWSCTRYVNYYIIFTRATQYSNLKN